MPFKRYKGNRAPTKDTLSSFSDIKKFINRNQNKEEKRINTQTRETVKMPFKRYKSIKMSVIKKSNKNKANNLSNSILAETHTKQKLMTKVIERRVEETQEEKKNNKLRFSHAKNKARFQDGVLNIGKNFMKKINSSENGQGNNRSNKNTSKGKSNFNKRR
mmetsp:Transcript_38829/g.40246  ORF Transcript_38829/g.40246 Transcript_38829/m.40246 type:complete len:161 (+) Transcript_38829:3-485(+)